MQTISKTNKLLTHILPLDTHRRSMGLPPSQGHNNLRLTNTANMYQNHNFRLDTTQFNTIQTHHSRHHMPKPMPKLKPKYIPQIQINSRPKHFSSVPMLTSILKPSRYQQCRNKNVDNHVQFASNRNTMSQRQTPYSYSHHPDRKTSSIISDKYRTSDYRNVRFKTPLPNVTAQMKEHRNSSRHKSRKNTIISNMPLINVNSSVLMVNHSPFGLRDPRFGIFHHCSQSISYF